MGQKVHPVGLRLGIIQDWRSRWFAGKGKFAKFLENDLRIREYLGERLARAGISRIEIERADKSVSIAIHTARPGIVIGKGGIEVDQIRKDIERMENTKDVQIGVLEVRFPELDANLVAQNIAQQLVARVPFRRALKRAVSSAMKTGAEGVKVMISGRLGGREMSRTEWYREGRVPLHTLRADIDYGFAIARTTFGSIGVKAWIYKGEKAGKYEEVEEEPLGLTKPKKRADKTVVESKQEKAKKAEVKKEKEEGKEGKEKAAGKKVKKEAKAEKTKEKSKEKSKTAQEDKKLETKKKEEPKKEKAEKKEIKKETKEEAKKTTKKKETKTAKKKEQTLDAGHSTLEKEKDKNAVAESKATATEQKKKEAKGKKKEV